MRRSSRASWHHLACILALWGCGDGGGAGGLDTALFGGRVEVPDGVPSAEVRVVSSVGEAALREAGAFEVEVIAPGAPLVFALAPSGEPMLAGFLDAEHRELSSRSTAEVLVWFATGCPLIPLSRQPDALAALRTLDLDGLSAAIATSLSADPTSLVRANPPVTAALEEVVRRVQGLPAVPRREGALTLVDPSAPQSGVRIDQPPGFHTIQLVNSYRRRAYVYVDRVGYKTEEGLEVASPSRVTDHYLQASTGLNGALGTFIDLFNGQSAYTPQSDEPITLEPVEGAAETAFQVTVVGLGAARGVLDEVSAEQRDKAEWVWWVTGFWDVVLPVTLNVILPVATYGGADGLLGNVEDADVVLDLVGSLGTLPGAKDALFRGDIKGFAHIVFTQVATGSGTAQKALIGALTDYIFKRQLADAITDDEVMAFNRATGYAGQILNGLNVVNIITGAADFGVVAGHLASSSLADRWEVTVLPPEVGLDPETARVSQGAERTLRAVVPEATGSGEAPTLSYEWTHTGTAGTLRDARGHAGASFTTSEASVVFEASEDSLGTDTVTVVVSWVIVGDGPVRRVRLGEATATLEVVPELWDATADFSAQDNPNGAWTYGWALTVGGEVGAFTTQLESECGRIWGGFGRLGTPSIWRNGCAAARDGVGPGQLSLHPGCDANELAVLRWTAPRAGRFEVDLQWFAGDHGPPDAGEGAGLTDGYVLVDGELVEGFPETESEPHYTGILQLEAGATVDVAVGTHGHCLYDNTPVELVIAPSP